jgi:hypothetical protein
VPLAGRSDEGVDMWFVIVPFAVLLLASIVDVVTGGMD